MIRSLSGQLQLVTLDFIVVGVAGVGYKVFVGDASTYHTGNEVELFTYLAVRDDALDLYGFKTEPELELFEQLLTVTGVGPKSANQILSKAGITVIGEALSRADAAPLLVRGIGKKTAERIVLELAGKRAAASHESDDALKALLKLGYDEKEAFEVLKSIEGTSEERLKEALKRLHK